MDFKNKSVIGYLIFGVGVLALITVGYFSYKKFFVSSNSNDGPAYKSRLNTAAAPQDNRQSFARQKVITTQEIVGTWQAPMDGAKGFLELTKGKYRIFIMVAGSSNVRYYSFGSYTIKEDVLILQPDTQKAPSNDPRYDYRLLTQAKMPVMAVRVKDKMVWQVPSGDVRIYVPPRHPFFRRTKDEIAIWSRLK